MTGSEGARERRKNTGVAGDSGSQWPGFGVVSGETQRGSEVCVTPPGSSLLRPAAHREGPGGARPGFSLLD